MAAKCVHVFLDLAAGDRALGRVIFELRPAAAPLACENFRGLCTGEYGRFAADGAERPLHFRGASLFRARPGAFAQGGDVERDDGSGARSIFGGPFADERTAPVDAPGLLVSAAPGRNANSSQFLVSLAPLRHLGERVVLGRAVYGLEAVRMAAELFRGGEPPGVRVHIVDAGQVGDERLFLTADPLGAEGIARIRAENSRNRLFFEAQTAPTAPALPGPAAAPQAASPAPAGPPPSGPFAELRGRISAALLDISDGAPAQPRRHRPIRKEPLKAAMEGRVRPRAESVAVEGWEIFNDDGFFNAYQKRAARLPVRSEDLLRSQTGASQPLSAEKRLFLAPEISAQQRARNVFSRPRAGEQSAAHVNDRNRVFNEKLQRFFGTQVRDVKNDIERPLG